MRPFYVVKAMMTGFFEAYYEDEVAVYVYDYDNNANTIYCCMEMKDVTNTQLTCNLTMFKETLVFGGSGRTLSQPFRPLSPKRSSNSSRICRFN